MLWIVKIRSSYFIFLLRLSKAMKSCLSKRRKLEWRKSKVISCKWKSAVLCAENVYAEKFEATNKKKQKRKRILCTTSSRTYIDFSWKWTKEKIAWQLPAKEKQESEMDRKSEKLYRGGV